MPLGTCKELNRILKTTIMLEVAIGIIFILLVFSLFATTVMEVINSLFGLRGKYLIRGLKRMLGDEKETELLASFKNHPMYKQLTSKFLTKERAPSYMSSSIFSSILWNILSDKKDGTITEDGINALKDTPIREVMTQLYHEAGADSTEFKIKIESWFDEVMERTTGWYKRNTQLLLLLVGLCIAIGFDADTLSIFRQLSNNPEAQLQITQLLDEYSATIDTTTTSADSLTFAAYKQDSKAMLMTQLDALHEPLGLGWNEKTLPVTPLGWLLKVLGWIITAFAISLGAPFWFDLLHKVMRIRSSGNIPQQIVVETSAIKKKTPPIPLKNVAIKSPVSPVAPPAGKRDVNVIESYG